MDDRKGKPDAGIETLPSFSVITWKKRSGKPFFSGQIDHPPKEFRIVNS
jgi:hypothetical protein